MGLLKQIKMALGVLILSLINLAAATICNGIRVHQNAGLHIVGNQSKLHHKNDNEPQFAGIVLEEHLGRVSARFRIDKPRVGTEQYSGAYISIESGDEGSSQFNQIQVGWIVYPHMYGDNEVHYFSRWIGDNRLDCFHSQGCQGFVPATKDPVFGRILAPAGKKHDGENWVLEEGINATIRGHWDHYLFGSFSIAEGATKVRFGGEVFTSDESHDPSPPMGSSRFNVGEYSTTSYFREIRIDGKFPDTCKAKTVQIGNYYSSDLKKLDDWRGYGFFYGGRGG